MAMSKGRNVTFNAVMDEELLDGMYEQVLLSRKADHDFKGEAYEAVAVAMTVNSNGEYVLTKQSIVNRCKYHKKTYSIATELLNASGFGYDNTTKRIIAVDDVWTTWIEGHPNAKPYRAKVTNSHSYLVLTLPRDNMLGLPLLLQAVHHASLTHATTIHHRLIRMLS